MIGMSVSDKILNMYFATHQTCNLMCRYCYIPEEIRKSPRTKDIQIIDALKLFIAKVEFDGFKIGTFCLHGSEPSLMNAETMCEIVESVNQHWTKNNVNGLNVSIQTNGIRFTKEYLNILKQNLENPKKLRISFSIDPPKKVHDYLRNNSYNKVIENMDEALKTGFPVGILCVVSNETFKYMEEFGKWLKFYNNMALTIGNPYKIKFKFATGIFALNENEMEKFSNFLLESDLLRFTQILTPGYCIQRGNECIWYEFDIFGNCYSCNKAYNNEGIFANWKKESFETIVNKRRNLYISEYQNSDCAECDYELLCNSGCSLDRHYEGKMRGKALECTLIRTVFSESEKNGKHIYDIINNKN
ncbi:MAG: radical SAM protein [Bacteroidetes bacterium]|nr:MAG: radical SAM protein [Bacteroidota bacterium]